MLNQYPTSFKLRDLLDTVIREVFLNLNCHGIGTVQEFNSEKRTVKVTLNYQKTMNVADAGGVYKELPFNHPVLMDCPVVVLGGGTAELTFPISKGDECLILFNDRDLDNWFAGNPPMPPETPRMHSFSDGVALIGLRSLARKIEGYDSERAVLRNDKAMVGVGPELIKISNDLTTLNTLISSLIQAIEQITIDVAGVGPAQGTVSPASVLALESVKEDFGGLLE